MNDQFEIMLGLDKENAFEGWFYKVDDVENDFMLSVIWGYSTFHKDPHAFLQITSSLTHETKYIRYPIEEMSYQTNPFIVKIGDNLLSKKKMTLSMKEPDFEISGEFRNGAFQEIKKSFLKPNIMGILTYLPNECNHSITSMHHTVDGWVNINMNQMDIHQANGYIEKDWGTSFPSKYVWVQTNFHNGDSIVFSNATVPVLGKNATGFFLVLHYQGQEYRFSTVERSRMLAFEADDEQMYAKMKKGNLILELSAAPYNPVGLQSPKEGEMNTVIKESLDGELEVKLWKNKELIAKVKSERASMDLHFN